MAKGGQEMKTIPLSQGQFALVDDDDYEYLSRWKWYASYARGTKSYYAMRNSPSVNGKRQSILMHRVIMDAKKGEQVDHENHETLDNQRGNLRLTTSQGNQQNARLRTDNISGFCGVTWHKRDKKWRAQIQVDGKVKDLGCYVTLGAAIFARKAANCQYGFHLNHGSQGVSQERVGYAMQ